MNASTKIFSTLLAGCFLLTLGACASPVEEAPDDSGSTEDDIVTKRDCDVSKVLCEIVPPTCPAGQTASVDADGFCYGPCVAIDQCKPKSFNCHQGGPALCEIVPPRCPSGQTSTTIDGCYGPCVPSEVCIGSGGGSTPPEGTADCDITRVQCEIVTPRCPAGETPTVDANGFCYGECVPVGQCKPHSYSCDDGRPVLCEIVPPTCDEGESPTVQGGCYGPCVPNSVCR